MVWSIRRIVNEQTDHRKEFVRQATSLGLMHVKVSAVTKTVEGE